MHTVRIAIVIALLAAIPSARRITSDGSETPTPAQLSAVSGPLPVDWSVGDRDSTSGLWQLLDSKGKPQGWIARTLPAAVDVIGYRGPTDALVVLSPDLMINSVALLSSDDTKEHVAAVVRDDTFFQQFRGWKWSDPKVDVPIDGVSGATLTSLALAEGIIARMGGSRPSLLFPDPIAVEEILDWFPTAHAMDDAAGIVFDADAQPIGRVLRTGPYSDDLIGYQGPTELLLRVSHDRKVTAVRLRRSYDNEPYVDYVRMEFGFWKLFVDMTIDQLAVLRPQQAGVEGVSGATMTSLTVADTIVAATSELVAESTKMAPTRKGLAMVRWTRVDLATIAIICLAGLMSRLGWFRQHAVRRLWLVTVVVVIGFWAGNLVSLALIAGWSAEGIAWRLAPGLSAIVFVAMVVPPIRKGNPYCNHLCPHGALQQLIKPGRHSRRRYRLSRTWTRRLPSIPGWLLVIAYLTLICLPSTDLSSWEPFHAYLFRMAGWGSLVVAALSLALATVIPMGYCRLGCPTGRLIDYVRLSATSDRIARSDLVALALVLLALALPYIAVSSWFRSLGLGT